MKRFIIFSLKILLLLVLTISTPIYSSEISLKRIYEEKINKKGKDFKEKLNFCLKENKNIEEFKKCDEILKEYEKILWSSFDEYYKLNLKKAKLTDIKTVAKAFKIDKYNFVFLKIYLNPKKYEILDIFINSKKQLLSPRCYGTDYIQVYFPVKTKNLKITVYYTDKKIFREFLDKFIYFKSFKLDELKLPEIRKFKLNLKIDRFRKFRIKMKKMEKRILIKLPVSVEAYISYDFIGMKKYFPKDNQCYKSEITIKEIPDTVYIRLIIDDGKGVKPKDFRVY